MGAIRWSEEEYRQHSGDEVIEILRLSGLPHQRRSLEPATGKVAEYPEAQECPDPMVEEGLKIGRALRGRGGLPVRLQPHGGLAVGARGKVEPT